MAGGVQILTLRGPKHLSKASLVDERPEAQTFNGGGGDIPSTTPGKIARQKQLETRTRTAP